MNELVSYVVELNSENAFRAFHEAVVNSVELLLGEKLLRDYQLITDRVKTATTPECLLIPEILNVILSNLDPRYHPNARLVCRKWNDVITMTQAPNFRLTFNQKHQMIKFMSSGPSSKFCRKIRKFKFGTESIESSERIFYESFFAEFGSNIVDLELSETLNTNLLRLIFSSKVQPYLRNVRLLKAETFQKNTAWLPADESLSFLSNLHSLELTESTTENSLEYMLHFLEKFLQNDHHLKTITLGVKHRQANQYFPAGLIKNLVKNHTIQELTLKRFINIYFNNECLELMTVDEKDSFFQTLSLALREVDLAMLHKFLCSHSRTLEKLIFHVPATYNSFEKIQTFPRLESLKSFQLTLNTTPVSPSGWASFSDFSFVNRMPKLKTLIFVQIGHPLSPIAKEFAPFEHTQLTQLIFRFLASAIGDGTWILSFINYVPQCFPSLSTFEIDGANRVNASWSWPTRLGHLVLQKQTEQQIVEDKVTWIAQAKK